MKVEYDKGADALYMTLRKGRYNISEEISDEVTFMFFKIVINSTKS